MNQVLKVGMSGTLVESLQLKFNMPVNGVFDANLKNNITEFQTKNGLLPDGIVGPLTWDKLNIRPDEIFADTDSNTSASWIIQYPLPEGEYVDTATSKKWIILHANHGTSDPYKQIDEWAKDQRGRVGSHYVIGGPNPALDINLENTENDGVILQAIKDLYYGFHLGAVKNQMLQTNSISIELCSAGPLTKKHDKYFTWYGLEVHPSQVVELNGTFKEHRYFHKYSEKQIESLKALLLLIRNRHGINLKSGIYEELIKPISKPGSITTLQDIAPYEWSAKNEAGKVEGLFTHGNLNKHKLDLSPQPELSQMIRSLQ